MSKRYDLTVSLKWIGEKLLHFVYPFFPFLFLTISLKDRITIFSFYFIIKFHLLLKHMSASAKLHTAEQIIWKLVLNSSFQIRILTLMEYDHDDIKNDDEKVLYIFISLEFETM